MQSARGVLTVGGCCFIEGYISRCGYSMVTGRR